MDGTATVFREERALVVETPTPALLLQTIPGAFDLGGGRVGMQHDNDTVVRLNVLGVYAEPPIITYYHWPRSLVHIPQPFDHQKITAAFASVNPRAYILNDIGCVDAATEYLSPTGWRRMDQYDGEEVAQYDPQTGAAELVQPEAYVKKPCAEMIRFKTTYGVDQLLSPDHTVLYVASAGGRMTTTAAEVEARHHSAVMGWPGRFITTFTPPERGGVPLSDSELQLMVAVIADGYFPPGDATRVVLRLKKQRKKDRLRRVLTAAGYLWRETSNDTRTATGFTVFRFDAPRRVKEFDAYFWACSPAQLKIIAEELEHWDGTSRKTAAASFSSTSKASADFAQYAYASTGRTASLRAAVREGYNDEYVVHARKNAALLYLRGCAGGEKTRTVWREPSPDGFMYCFNVPTGFLVLRRNGCVFATGNTGKTLSALWAADYLMSIGAIQRALFVSPLSTLERAWGDSIFINFPHRSFAVLHGSAERRRKLLAQPKDFYIINFDGVGTLLPQLIGRDDLQLVCIDELATLRNSQTKSLWKPINTLLYPPKPHPPRPWVWGMTGTPTPNAPTDAYGQCKLLTPGTVPRFYGQFRSMVMNHQSQFVWTPRPEANTIVRNVMRPAIRFRREECIDLPPTIYSTRDVEMSAEQKRHYQAIVKELRTDIEGHRVTAVNEGVKLSKLLQIACGVAYAEGGKAVEIDAGNRVEVLMELIEQVGAKVIVFVPFTAVTDMLCKKLNKFWNFAVVTGQTPIKERNQIFADFQSPKDIDIIAHPECMSHGLTLTEADTVIWYAPVDSNETYTQANGRITRPGQRYTANIIHLSGSAVERAAYTRLETRQSMQGALLEMYEKGELV